MLLLYTQEMWGNVLPHSHMCTPTHSFIVICVSMLRESPVLDQDSATLGTAYTEQKGISSQAKNINRSIGEK